MAQKQSSQGIGTLRTLLLSCLFVTFGAQPVAATINHGTFNGITYDYIDVSETSTSGDPEPLFGAPIIVGDNLVFTPTGFEAHSSDALCDSPTPQPGCVSGLDTTSAQLQTLIMSVSALDPIDVIKIDEFGEVDLSGVGGPTTGGFIGMAGVVTILEFAGSVPCVINLPTEDCQIPFTGTFSPTDLYLLPGDLGQTLFTGNATIDVGAEYANVTKAFLSFDNDMVVNSEDGTTAIMEKKPTIIISIVPEPSVLVLLGGGLIALSLRARARQG